MDAEVLTKFKKSHIYTARPKKSQHLDLTKKIGKILPLDDYCMVDYVVCPKNEVSRIY